ncbi:MULTISPECIES: cupin domain-containing protein [Franconibacter]|uniref:Cupin n=2 Tax=Franconibacter TaxID=1649295 RepID=A0A0J8VJ46_9ENTR|nr:MULTISPECIES: cupin domain-containing protein [Franconibacter]KMV33166.1 cupin [Franconibacter pulveris]MCK1970096.1 cupin domain-containing protein [Franconibacter sp. IITDAS19]MEB5923005.1 cupin domain-containing protein [Franconibacter daqui]GGD32663.1 cupin [Franconibacter daqui]
MVISKTNAEHYLWGGDCDGWHLVKAQDLSVIQQRMPSGRGEQCHYHETVRQCFFVISGEMTVELNNTVFVLKPGESLEVAPGQLHQIRNEANPDTEYLVISQPMTRNDRHDFADKSGAKR